MNKSGSQSFGTHMLSLGAGTILYMIVGFIGTPIITRLVDPTAYGRMSMLSVYSSFGMMLCGLGLDQTLVRFFYQSDDLAYKRKLLKTCFTYSVFALATLIVICSIYLAVAVKYRLSYIQVNELPLLLLNVLSLLLSRYVTLTLRLTYKTKAYSLVNIAHKVLYVLIAVILVTTLKDYHFVCLAIATIISTLISAAMGIGINSELWQRKGEYTELPYDSMTLLKYGLPLMLSSGISVVFNALDKLALNRYCSISDVGVYASAMNIMMVFSIVKTSFTALWMPSAVEHYERDADNTLFYQKGNAIISCVMIVFGAGVILCKDFIVLLLGSEYSGAAAIIPFLMFEPIMYTISESTATGIAISKKSGYQVIVSAGACILNLIGNMLLTPSLGGRGAALSTAIAYILFFALRTGLANRVFFVEYHLKRFALLVAMLFAFAYYGSLTVFSWKYLVFFGAICAMTMLAYREYVSDIVKMVKSFLQRIRR